MAENKTSKSPFAAVPATLIAPMTAMLDEMDRQADRYAEYAQAQLGESIKASKALRRQSIDTGRAMLEAWGAAASGAIEASTAWMRPMGSAA